MVADCERPLYAQAYCNPHYQRRRRGGRLDAPLQAPRDGECAVDGCDRFIRSRRLCEKHYRRLRLYGDPLGRKPREKATVVAASDGYLREYAPDHPNAQHDGYVLQHRLVMSRHLGRPLLPDESVHHRNGDRTDNHLGNLTLMASLHPAGQEVSDLVDHAITVLRRYAPGLIPGV